MAESARKLREEPAPELRIPERHRPEQLIDRHREWIAASTAAPYPRRKRAHGFRAASLLFPCALVLAAAALLLAVTLTGRGSEDPVPVREQLVDGGVGSETVVVKSPTPEAGPAELRDRDAGDVAQAKAAD